jgi:Cu/Ag efflux protein CusF
MRLLSLCLYFLVTLTACTGNLQLSNGGHASSSGPMGKPVQEVAAYGVVTQVAQEDRLIQIKHGPIPSLNWAPMLMTFTVRDNIVLEGFQKGHKVNFILELDKDENHRLKVLSPK